MTVTKTKMSASYKAIFILSIFMVFFILYADVTSDSTFSSGLSMSIWGYTALLMYLRRNAGLVSFYKWLLWFDAIVVSVVIAFLVFSDIDFGFSYGEGLVLSSVVISIHYGLYRYFSNLVQTLVKN